MVTTSFLAQILFFLLTSTRYGVMAELVDAVDSKSAGGNSLWVRFPLALGIKTGFDTIQNLSFFSTCVYA